MFHAHDKSYLQTSVYDSIPPFFLFSWSQTKRKFQDLIIFYKNIIIVYKIINPNCLRKWLINQFTICAASSKYPPAPFPSYDHTPRPGVQELNVEYVN